MRNWCLCQICTCGSIRTFICT
ncbi:RIKEN cDNA 1700129I04, isoform CRA_c [Mus musculus]|nr:RIKEN cDNA 1700129I04, isoform CRA_c [Mus musculus]